MYMTQEETDFMESEVKQLEEDLMQYVWYKNEDGTYVFNFDYVVMKDDDDIDIIEDEETIFKRNLYIIQNNFNKAILYKCHINRSYNNEKSDDLELKLKIANEMVRFWTSERLQIFMTKYHH